MQDSSAGHKPEKAARTVFPVPFPTAQYALITQAATLNGDSITTFIRQSAVRQAQRDLARASKKAA